MFDVATKNATSRGRKKTNKVRYIDRKLYVKVESLKNNMSYFIEVTIAIQMITRIK